MTGDQLLDAFECGTPKELWDRTIAHLRVRAAHSWDIARSLDRDAIDAAEQAAEHREAGDQFDALRKAMEKAPVTFPASCDTRPEGGDAPKIAAPSLTSGAVGSEADETPKGGRHDQG